MSHDDDNDTTGPSDQDEQREARRRAFSRREILRAGMAAPAVLSLPALLAACGSSGHSDSAQRTSANHGDHTDASGHSDHSDTGQHSDHADKAHSDHADATQHSDHADNAHTDNQHNDHADAPHTDHADGGHTDNVHVDKGQHFDFGQHFDIGHNDIHLDVPQHNDFHFDVPQHNDAHFDFGAPPTQQP